MGSVDRGIDRDLPLQLSGRVSLGDQMGVDLVPGPVRAEPAMPLPHRLPRPEPLWKITPGDPAPMAVHDALHHLPVDRYGLDRPVTCGINGSIRAQSESVNTAQRDITPPSPTTPRP